MASSYTKKVMVLDAHLRHSLALIRSLGQAGIKVLGVSSLGMFPAKVSRFCWRTAKFDPSGPSAETIPAFRTLVQGNDIDIVIPAALAGNEFLSKNRVALEPLVSAPFNDLNQFETLSQKNRTVTLGHELGVACPTSLTVEDPRNLDEIVEALKFPVVFKSIVDQGTVKYAYTPDELSGIARSFWEDNPALIREGLFPIVQEYIQGTGHGFYGLGQDGEIYAYFMHERMHEVPPSGGPSAMARSYSDEELKRQGEKFFAATRWNGPAMVEFKKSEIDGKFYLIEVNPKFWGSLELGISSGVDFPLYLYQQLSGYPITAQPGQYRQDHIFRWLTMDLAHSVQAHRVPSFLGDFLNRNIQDDFHWSDPVPSIVMFIQGIQRFF